MKQILIMLGLLMLAECNFAKSIVDVYGTTPHQKAEILKKFAKSVAEVEAAFETESQKSIVTGKENTHNLKIIANKRAMLKEQIKRSGNFGYVSLDTYSYSNQKDIFTTIEVVAATDVARLRFAKSNSQQCEDIPAPAEAEKTVFDHMIDYQNRVYDLFNKLPDEFDCPVYHCIADFDNPTLKPYLSLFNKAAITEKKRIIDTLHSDEPCAKRAAAALLVGHFASPQEIIQILRPFVTDDYAVVRNNAMRVIGFTLEQSKIDAGDIDIYFELLKSPRTSDRNKSLAILTYAATSKSMHSLIFQKARDDLLALLELNQPNNRNWAYLILRKISGKKYAAQDLNHWKQWAASYKPLVSSA